MTEEEKDLLLKDLCARLRYGVKAKSQASHLEINTIDGYFTDRDGIKMFHLSEPDFWQEVDYFQYYLRPMSSMTEEEKFEYDRILSVEHKGYLLIEEVPDIIDFYNSRYLDYRGLIPMGLALEAPENMYNI